MKFLLLITIGSWSCPDRIEFDTLKECERMAERFNYGKIMTECKQDA